MSDLQRLVALLDDSLTGGGWQRSSGMGAAKWQRTIDGRELVLRLSAMSRARYSGDVRTRERLGYKLRLDVSTSAPVRVFFVRAAFADSAFVRWVWRLRGQHRVAHNSGELDGFVVGATNPNWAHALTMDRQAMADIGSLLREGAAPDYAGSVYLSPRRLHYASPILAAKSISIERANTVVVQMLCIAERIDGLPAPSAAESETETTIERFARKRPMLFALTILGGALALLGGGAIIAIAVALMFN